MQERYERNETHLKIKEKTTARKHLKTTGKTHTLTQITPLLSLDNSIHCAPLQTGTQHGLHTGGPNDDHTTLVAFLKENCAYPMSSLQGSDAISPGRKGRGSSPRHVASTPVLDSVTTEPIAVSGRNGLVQKVSSKNALDKMRL